MEFMRAGGMPMWLTLLMGGYAIWVAISFAREPAEGKLALLRPLSVATIFHSLTGFVLGIGLTMKFSASAMAQPDGPAILLTGIGESSANIGLGFGLLTVAWMIITVGFRRQI
jgi:hypothetical protein